MKNILALMGDDELRPIYTHLMMSNTHLYVTNGYVAVRVKKNLIPYLDHNIDIEKDKNLLIHRKELKKLKGELFNATEKEFQFVDKKDQLTRAEVKKDPNEMYSAFIDKLINEVLENFEEKSGWNINGEKYCPIHLGKIANLLMEIRESDIASFNLNVGARGIGVVSQLSLIHI